MCFSPAASFTAATVLAAVGVFAIKQTRNKKELPYAAVPLLFAAQQFIEGVVWLSFSSNNLPLKSMATFAYTLFSHVLWPAYIPFAVLLLEKVAWRKKVLTTFLLLGVALGLYFFSSILSTPIPCQIINKSISYDVPRSYLLLLTFTYLITTCGSCLVSSHKWIKIFGVATFLSAVLAFFMYYFSFISVWCFFSAVLSMIVLMFFYSKRK